MKSTLGFQRLLHLPRRIVREFLMVADVILLFWINRLTERPVTEPGGPVVSLTTFGKRAEKVHFAIESIARGSVRPSRLILWIDDEVLMQNLPAPIRRLQKRGLEVIWCRNYGPHKKYFPYVQSQVNFDKALVTVDDDFLYPRYWLKKLVEANREYPEAVNCYWAKTIAMNQDGVERYWNWRDPDSTSPSFLNFGLCGMGAIFPPRLLMALRQAGTSFEACCPKGDDLWLHVQALRAGFKVRQILPKLPYFSFQGVPGTQQTALSYENVTYGDGNDRQLRATYTDEDFRVLRAEWGAARN